MNTVEKPTKKLYFGKRKTLPVLIYYEGSFIESDDWDEELWIERSEDWYALDYYKDKKVRIIKREDWIRGREVN